MQNWRSLAEKNLLKEEQLEISNSMQISKVVRKVFLPFAFSDFISISKYNPAFNRPAHSVRFDTKNVISEMLIFCQISYKKVGKLKMHIKYLKISKF